MELESKRDGLVNELQIILDKAKNEKRSFSADEKAKVESLKSEISDLNDQVKTQRFADEQKKSEVKKHFEKSEEKRSEDQVFNLGKVLKRAMAGQAQEGYESEVIEKTKREFEKAGYSPMGNELYIPSFVLEQRSTVTTSSAANWLKVNQSNDLSLVRTPVLYKQLGVTIYNDLTGGKFDAPNLADITAVFASEDSAASDISLTPGKATLTAQFVPATASFSRQMLSQTNEAIQSQIMDAFVYAIDKAIDKKLYSQLSGLTNSVSTGVTYANILTLEAATNATDLKFLSSFKGRNYLKSKEKNSSGTVGNFIWGGTQGDNQVAGYPSFASPQVPNALYVLGDFAQAAVGFWGGLIITIDPYSAKSSGNISMQVARMADVQIVNSAAFAITKNGMYI